MLLNCPVIPSKILFLSRSHIFFPSKTTYFSQICKLALLQLTSIAQGVQRNSTVHTDRRKEREKETQQILHTGDIMKTQQSYILIESIERQNRYIIQSKVKRLTVLKICQQQTCVLQYSTVGKPTWLCWASFPGLSSQFAESRAVGPARPNIGNACKKAVQPF